MFPRIKRWGRKPRARGTGEPSEDEPQEQSAGKASEDNPRSRRRTRRRARRIIPMEPRRDSRRGDTKPSRGGGRKKPEPEFRGSDIFAMVIAGLQVILPYFFIILAAIVVTYLLVAAFFGM
ncbi:MAG: hypothetical protein WD492_16245 [Alkalispirochaeta sp.]